MNNFKTKILICCHKQCELPPDPDGVFLPIQVGAAISDNDLGIQRDDQVNGLPCDNISFKNNSYCELTAMYWAWKNIRKLYPDIEYIGLNHYRRYFSIEKGSPLYHTRCRKLNNIKDYKININKLKKILSRYKLIIAKPSVLQLTLEITYGHHHISEDLNTVRDIIHELYPEYDKSYHNTITLGNRFSGYNMFIMKIDDFESLCKWLFDILFEAEKRINTSTYNIKQKRVFGYLSERLLNVWCSYQNKKIYNATVILYTNDQVDRSPLHNALMIIRNNISSFLSKPLSSN